jgi:hypothetical protein
VTRAGPESGSKKAVQNCCRNITLFCFRTGHVIDYALTITLARFPARWNHLAEKDSRQISMLEQILIAKVFNLGGICFMTVM